MASTAAAAPLWKVLGALPLLLVPAVVLLSGEARAHHLIDLVQQRPTPLAGLLSGLAHPVFGPDHLLFLLALSLVGLRHRSSWMLGLLATGLGGSLAGLLLPGLPAADALVALTLVLVGLVLLGRLDRRLLLPAFALHGYALSASVLGWSGGPLLFYLAGLLLSQGALLLLALQGLKGMAAALPTGRRQAVAAALLGCGTAWTWSALVG